MDDPSPSRGAPSFDARTAKSVDKGYRTPEIVALRDRLRTALGLRLGETVIDAGCGTGLLCEEMASDVGSSGRVIGVDASAPMLNLADERCGGRPEIELHRGDIHALPSDDASADALVCMQVLLFVSDVGAALKEFHRVLKHGGRIAIVETDWRSAVLNSSDRDLTHRLFEFWDSVAASPNLPSRLGPLLRDAGFEIRDVEAVPVLNTEYTPDTFSQDYIKGLARQATAAGAITTTEANEWLGDLDRKGQDGAYFFCVNRFLFTATKT